MTASAFPTILRHIPELSPEPDARPLIPPLEQVGRDLLNGIGEDPNRAGLLDTPKRFAKAYARLTGGYEQTPEEVVGTAIFEEPSDATVIVRNIEFYSMCEHHLLPFFGRVDIAYVPDGRVVGLSKLPRLVEVFARRLQLQERLTDQVAQAVEDVLAPRGVAVIAEASHMCMMMRGIEKQQSTTITTAVRGSFADDSALLDRVLRMTTRGER